MPAVFQIVSRASGNALWWSGLADAPDVGQDTIIEDATTEMWTLQPRDSAQDCLILPVSAQGQAIGLPSGTTPGEVVDLQVVPTENAQIWRISRRLANPPYFYLLEGDNDMLMTLASGEDQSIHVAARTEHANQQWTFLPSSLS